MNRVALIFLGAAVVIVGGFNFYEQRTIDRLRDELQAERSKRTASMRDTVNALQVVVKYQNYLKEKGIPLP